MRLVVVRTNDSAIAAFFAYTCTLPQNPAVHKDEINTLGQSLAATWTRIREMLATSTKPSQDYKEVWVPSFSFKAGPRAIPNLAAEQLHAKNGIAAVY